MTEKRRLYQLECSQCGTTTPHMLVESRRGRLDEKNRKVDPLTNRLLAPTPLILDAGGDTEEIIAKCLQCSWRRRYGLQKSA